MPWEGKQAQAIFLDRKRKGGQAYAERYMRAHGNKSEDRKAANVRAAKRRLRKKHRKPGY